MDNNSFNIFHDIDWTKEDLPLITSSGVLHLPFGRKTVKDLSKNTVPIFQWNVWKNIFFYYLTNRQGEYLCLDFYRIGNNDLCTFAKAKSFDMAVSLEESPNLNRGQFQIRIYPDRKVSIVYRLSLMDKNIYYCHTKETNGDFQSSRNGQLFCFGKLIAEGNSLVSTNPEIIRTMSDLKLSVVNSDDDIRKFSFKANQSPVSRTFLSVSKFISKQDGKYIDLSNFLDHQYFDPLSPSNKYPFNESKKTKDVIKDFFEGSSSEANDPYLSYKKSVASASSISVENVFDYFLDFRAFLIASDSKKTKENMNSSTDIVASCFQDEWAHPQLHSKEVAWARVGNLICFSIQINTGFNRNTVQRCLLSHNVKTHENAGILDTIPCPRDWKDDSSGTPLVDALHCSAPFSFAKLSQYKYSSSFDLPVPKEILDAEKSICPPNNQQNQPANDHPVSVIKDGLSVKELFQGSDVGWLLDNVDLNSPEVAGVGTLGMHNKSIVVTPLKYCFEENSLGTTPLLMVMRSTKEMSGILEKLLKARLFNVYFAMLEDGKVSRDGPADKSFCSRTKDEYDKKLQPLRYRIAEVHRDGAHPTENELDYISEKTAELIREYSSGSMLFYDGKQKTLQKAFGMTMPQLRKMNNVMTLVASENSRNVYYSSCHIYRFVPGRIGPMLLALTELEKGQWSLNELDRETFDKLLEMSMLFENSSRLLWKMSSLVSLGAIGKPTGFSIKKQIDLAQEILTVKISESDDQRLVKVLSEEDREKDPLLFIKKTGIGVNRISKDEEEFNEYNDYLRMRKLGGFACYCGPEQEAIRNRVWQIIRENPDRFPMYPKGAKKFFRFVPDRPLGEKPAEENEKKEWLERLKLYEDRFILKKKNDFHVAYHSGNFTESRDENGFLLGITIKLSKEENIKALHQELNELINANEEKRKREKAAADDELFKTAVKRVIPLQWEDKDEGLMIVAPNDTEEIIEEGKELHHCVGSYIDSIIKGSENIVFLRDTKFPSDPYYTVDVWNKQIRQVHCWGNGGIAKEEQERVERASGMRVYKKTHDILGFLRKWCQAKKGLLDEESVKTKYAALCAERSSN